MRPSEALALHRVALRQLLGRYGFRQPPVFGSVLTHTDTEESDLAPQGAYWRLRLLVVLAQQHPQLAWNTFIDNSVALLSPNPKYAPLITSQYVPEYFWNGAEPDLIEAWVRAHVAAEMSQNVERGMEAVRFRRSEQQSLVAAIDTMSR